MCGLVAQYGPGNADELAPMLDRLEHRGPDDSGTHEIGGNWLGHRRLSIVDVEGGHQPLSLADSSAYLVGNGEIYNHLGLRRLLTGRKLLTRSDNEVALHLIDRDGPSSLARLNGMFALVFAAEDGRFVAARDPVGIKPLYWARRSDPDGGETVRFASELHAFDPSWQSVVEPFPPGCAWTPSEGLIRFASAVPADVGTSGPAPANPVRGTREVLIDAVQRQMMGDVPVGVFLSGGLDSSLVAAIAARYLADKGDQLQTFAVGTPESPDIAAAREIAEFIGSAHHEILYDGAEALDALAGVVRCIESFDPALVRSAVPNYLLARETVKHVKVVLTGEGADELFAGYEYMREFDDDAPALHDELERTIDGLHNLNLQRADRVTMAHSLEARVPFLDREVIAWSMRLPAALKIPGADEMEKQLLREAFAGWLPEHLLWRVKAQFGDGSGARDVLSDAIVQDITDEQFEAERNDISPPLRTKEELAYYRVWRAWLPDVDPEKTLTRFATA